MQKSIIRKGLVSLVIILFIGIAVAPSVTSIEFSKNKTLNGDLVEITLQLCKSDGVEDHKMFITQEQNEQLERLIESFKVDLDNAETREETIEIYKNMVVSLDKLGILPESTSCKEVQDLVTGENSISSPEKIKSIRHFNQAYEKLKDKNSGLDENSNMLCQISGETTRTEIAPFLCSIILCSLILRLELFRNLYEMLNIFLIERLRIWIKGSFSNIFNFAKSGGLMTFGFGEWQKYFPYECDYYPTEGWIYTNGLNGIKRWEGSFYGNIYNLPYSVFTDYYLGVISFTGIKIIEKNFFQGSALLVKLTNDPPT